MARWTPVPIVGGAYSDDSKPWAAQDCVNFIVTPAERGGTRSPGKLTCLPGYTTFCASMQSAPVRGLHDVEGLLLAVTGDTLYRIGTDGAATSIGTIPGVGRVSMAHNQVTYGHEVMIANGQSGYVYNTYTGAFGQVTDDGFSGFTVCDFVDGYIAGTDPQGRFWAHGMLRQAGEFNTLDQYDSEAAPDKVRSLIVSHREVMILNERTASFSGNTGAGTGTFQNSNGTEMDVGIASPWARARLDNTVYWLGNDGIVYRLAGHSPQRVSTGPIEQAISRCDMSKAFAFTFEDRGHKVFYLTFPDGQTWGYDVWTSEWHRRQSKGLNRWRIDALVKWNGVWIAGDFSNGKLYQLDWAVQSEAGEEMERRRISAVLHDNGNRVTVNAVKIEVDTGLGANSTPLPDPILSPLSISGDLPDGYVGDSGTYQYTATGGLLQYGDFTIIAGSLPPGATMDAAGLLTYDYTTKGDYSWTVQVEDADGAIASVSDAAAIGLGNYWNPLDKAADLTLSDGNRTATSPVNGAAYQKVRAIEARSSGKWYFEVQGSPHPDTYDNGRIGLDPPTAPIASAVGASSGSFAIQTNGYRQNEGASVDGQTSPLPGTNVVMVAWDADAGHLWYGVSGVWGFGGDPAAGTSPSVSGVFGPLLPAANLVDGVEATFTISTLPAHTSYDPPGGFERWLA